MEDSPDSAVAGPRGPPERRLSATAHRHEARYGAENAGARSLLSPTYMQILPYMYQKAPFFGGLSQCEIFLYGYLLEPRQVIKFCLSFYRCSHCLIFK